MGRQGGGVRIIEQPGRDDNIRINVIAVFMGEAFAFHKQSPSFVSFVMSLDESPPLIPGAA
jgi:hypothetical protein